MKRLRTQLALLLLVTPFLLTSTFGQIQGVVAGTDLTGGGMSGYVTLNLNTSMVPQLYGANTFTGNQTVNGNLSATGAVNASSFQIGNQPFAFGSSEYGSAYLGFAGNTTTTGYFNFASGFQALLANTTGQANTAVGNSALIYNNAGQDNTGIGGAALSTNTTGNGNTAVGAAAGSTFDSSYLTGSNNTAVGSGAYLVTGTLNNATAIGSNALVGENNAVVLGSINGVNGATASVNVGIGTTAPTHTLEVNSPGATVAQMAMITNGTDAAFSLKNTASGGREYWIDSGSGVAGVGAGNFAVYDRTAGQTRLVVNSAGRVGIGTTSPDDLLSVNGSADKVGGGSWGTYSDGRLKNLNGGFNSGLSQVLKIRPIRYRYKPDNALGIRDTDEHVGVVAQEVQQIIPKAVTENSKGYLLVNNDPIIWAMLNAIKEQQGQIKQQQSLLRAQSSAMRSLETEVRETRENLRKVKAQVAATQLTVVAAK